LAAVAWPDAAAAGGVVNLRWEVENLGDQPVVGLALRADLPAGLVVTPADVAPPLSYDPAAKRLGWIVPALAPNARQGATVAARVAGARVGDVATVNGELALEDGRRVAASGAAVRILAPALRPSRVGPAGGTVELEDGRVTLTFAAGVVERPVTVWARPLGRPADAPGNILRAHEFSVRDQGDAEIHTFSQPVTLTVRYPEGEPACGRLFVRDEMTGLWEMLPTVWDAAAGALVARAPHLSTTGEGNNFAPEVMPSLRGLQTDLFSGAASYAYRVSVPPGRGGTAPGVTLGFSSRSRLEDAGHSSVTGAGWKLSADSFIYGTPWLTGSAPNTWRVAGAAFSEGGTGGAPYLKEAPQWRIQYAGAGADAYAPDGTRYHFEAALHDWWCQGTTWRQRTDKWALQYVLDPMSNRVDYIYDTDLLDNDSDSDLPINPLHVDTNPAYYGGLLTDSSPPAAARARTVRIAAPCANDGSGGNEDIHYLAQINLARISYNGGKSTIDFTYAVTRTDAALSDRSDISSWAHYTTRLLTAVKVRQDGSLIAAYKLAYDFYDDAQGRADKRVYALRSVGRCSDDALTNCLPATTFANTATQMLELNNGYGGIVRLDYGLDNVVAARTVTDTVTNRAETWNYTYTERIYNGVTAAGYRYVTETLPASLGTGNWIAHQFRDGSAGEGFLGQEERQSAAASNKVQAETIRTWQSTTTGVYSGAQLVYLGQELQKTYDQDGLNPLARKTYHANVSNLDALTCSGAVAVAYGYNDTAGGNAGLGRRTAMTDTTGSTAWGYDLRGRAITETKVISQTRFVTTYSYRSDDLLAGMTYPDGEPVSFGYDARGWRRRSPARCKP
jgi:hypothetical protein